MSVTLLTDKVWKIAFTSNVYVLCGNPLIVIDTGHPRDRERLQKALEGIVKHEDVKIVIFTHLHYDHTGGHALFPKATFYASQPEIDSFRKDPTGSVVSSSPEAALPKVTLNPLRDMHGLQIIETPGHTAGSVCIWYPEERMLFSGDTLFSAGIGRTDLPTSRPELMEGSLKKLKDIPYKILCPGHDY
jgi:hydroxyacylglutathione hydrolase